MEAIDCIESLSTGTMDQPYEVEFEVPHWAKRIARLEPYVLLRSQTARETVIIHYRIMREKEQVVRFISEAIEPPADFKQFHSTYSVKTLYVDIPVTPNEKLKLIRTNEDPYTEAPRAGLLIRYAS